MTNALKDKILFDRVSQFGITLTEKQIDLLTIFIDLLIEWNNKINLIGMSDRSRVTTELVLDSIVPVLHLPSKGRMIDLGSGAGFPAVIIKILKPDLEIKLIESNGKKVNFLKYAIYTLKLTGIIPVNSRIETITESMKSLKTDIVTSRAMANLEKIIRLSEPFLKPGGIIVGFLGKDGRKELKNIKNLLFDYNLNIKKTITYCLPGKKTERTTAILQKNPAL